MRFHTRIGFSFDCTTRCVVMFFRETIFFDLYLIQVKRCGVKKLAGRVNFRRRGGPHKAIAHGFISSPW